MPNTRQQKTPKMPGTSSDLDAFKVIMEGLLEDKLKPVTDSVASLAATLNEVKATLTDVVASVEHSNKVADKAKSIATQARVSVNKLQVEHDQLRSDHILLRDKLLKLEAYSRRENLKFEGVDEVEPENCMDTIMEVLSKMDVPDDVQIDRAHRVGPYRPQNSKPITIIMRFTSYSERFTQRTTDTLR